MKQILLLGFAASGLFLGSLNAQETLESVVRELQELRRRVVALEQANLKLRERIEVDRLIVKKELIVSDTGVPWEIGYEAQQIPRGIYARSLWDGPGGLWVRSRLIKGELDDPFDDRFHAIERNGSLRRVPGHISWNIWIDGAWRQMAIIQGEAMEPTEVPMNALSGGNHPGRLRFQTYRPQHDEPLTDAVIGQGMMSLGGGGFGGGGLPYPNEVLQLWGGELRSTPMPGPHPPRVLKDDRTGSRQYSLIAIGPQGRRSVVSAVTPAGGLATLRWESVLGADAYIVVRDGKEITGPIRLEGTEKTWTDTDGR